MTTTETGRWPVIADHVEGVLTVDGLRVFGWLEHGRERLSIWSLATSRPDTEWTHTDKAGHFHAYGADGRLPTLLQEDTPVDYDTDAHDGDCPGYAVTA